MEKDRKKEVINICLDHFIENGLTDTSTRSLSGALQLQNAGLYYYFASKDEVVIVCAEEAIHRIEDELILPTIKEITNPDVLMCNLQKRANKMSSTMKFLTSVCSNKRYSKSVRPMLNRLSLRYEYYAQQAANLLGCEEQEITPYVYMIIVAATNYMVFGENALIVPQIEFVKEELKRFSKEA